MSIKRFLLKLMYGKKTFWSILKGKVYVKTRKKRKFNIGAANTNIGSDWFSSDIDVLNITKREEWQRLLGTEQVDNIVAEHVWEHLTDTDTELANRNCFTFLKANGCMRLAVPDGFHIDAQYIEYVRPGGIGAGADDHKVLYTYKLMQERLEKAGFKVVLLEYWDEQGNFHFQEWSDEGGRISRSKRYDDRNSDGKLGYTSLIVDAFKP